MFLRDAHKPNRYINTMQVRELNLTYNQIYAVLRGARAGLPEDVCVYKGESPEDAEQTLKGLIKVLNGVGDVEGTVMCHVQEIIW